MICRWLCVAWYVYNDDASFAVSAAAAAARAKIICKEWRESVWSWEALRPLDVLLNKWGIRLQWYHVIADIQSAWILLCYFLADHECPLAVEWAAHQIEHMYAQTHEPAANKPAANKKHTREKWETYIWIWRQWRFNRSSFTLFPTFH